MQTQLTMSLVFMSPASKIMAFGGDATGNRNAQEQQSVNGTINWSGAIFMDCA